MLADIGIATNEDGSLSITDQSKMDNALNNNFEAVSQLFTVNTGATSNLNSNQYGVFEQLNKQLTNITSAFVTPGYSGNGVIPTRIQSLNDQMSSIDDQVANMEVLMTQKEASLTAQFTAMETLVSSIQSSGNALISSLANFSASTSSSTG